MELKDKTILITGGARVGQTVASVLLEAGAKLAMTYRLEPGEAHPQAKAYQADMVKEASVRQLMATAVKDLGAIDGLVNMVSVFEPDPDDLSAADIERIFTVNAFGNMLVSRLFAEAAREQGAKNRPIISFIDWAVDHPYAGYDAYIAAKAALRHYLMALQSSFAGYVRVVNLHPGMILEPPNFPAAEKETIINNTPTGSIGDPKQAAGMVKAAMELDYLVDNVYLAGGQQWRHRLADRRI